MSGVKRRDFVSLLGSAAVAWPLAARAQQPAVPVIGILGGQLPETYEPFLVPFRQGLSEVGFVEGNNVAIESRWAQGRYDRLPDLADVLVSRRVALIYAIGGTEVALAAKGATQIIPIVITIGGDPVKAGVVASLNRPGGNVTGTSFFTVGLGTKRLELLYELVPRASVIAVLVQTGSAIVEEQLSDLPQAANALRLRLVVLAVTGDADLEPAFAKVALEGAGALCVTAGAFFTSRRDKLVALAAQHRIPTMYPRQEHVAAGGLEPISKSPEEDNEASELYEAEEVVGVVFPTDEDAALPLNPSKEALHEPTSHIAA